MNNYLLQVEAAIKATVFHSSTTYSWFGKVSEQLPPRIKRALTPKTARGYLLYNLESQLYSDFYLRSFAAPKGWQIGGSVTSKTSLVATLSDANSGSGYCESGWEVRTVTDSEVVVYRGGLELWVRPEECLVPEESLITPGMQLGLRFPKEFLGISPGFYMALSEQEIVYDNSQPLVRLYWNLTAEGAVPFVRTVTSMLNRAHLPFKLKVLHDPGLFTRCDAAVVYVFKADYLAVADILGRVYPEIVNHLKPGTPVFTKVLARGVGFAEDPGQAKSFGQHRCQLLADGMIRAYEQGARSIDERLQVVVDRFAEDRISLDRPFLNPDSSDDYTFQVVR
jgi:HopA1 effector protein family